MEASTAYSAEYTISNSNYENLPSVADIQRSHGSIGTEFVMMVSLVCLNYFSVAAVLRVKFAAWPITFTVRVVMTCIKVFCM